MLKKLMKHEFHAMGRMLLPMYSVVLVLTLLNKGLLLFTQMERFANNSLMKIAFGLLTTFYIMALFVMLIGTAFVIIQRFYKHLFSKEGYLSFTLPVTPTQHLNVKLFSGILWTLFSGLMLLLSVFVLVIQKGLFSGLPQVLDDLGKMIAGAPAMLWIILIEIVVLIFAALLQGILQSYASIALGQRLMPDKRILGAVLSYFMIQVAMQVLLFIGMFFIGFFGVTFSAPLESFLMDTDATSLVAGVLLAPILVCGVSSAVFYYLTHNTMKKHLNLE